MGNLPLPIKIILNTIIGALYFFFMFFGGAFLGGFTAGMIGYGNMDTSKIVNIIGVLSLVGIMITITYRKYFYIMNKEIIEIQKEKTEQNN